VSDFDTFKEGKERGEKYGDGREKFLPGLLDEDLRQQRAVFALEIQGRKGGGKKSL